MVAGKKSAKKPMKLKDKMRAAYKGMVADERRKSDRCPKCGKGYDNCECEDG